MPRGASLSVGLRLIAVEISGLLTIVGRGRKDEPNQGLDNPSSGLSIAAWD